MNTLSELCTLMDDSDLISRLFSFPARGAQSLAPMQQLDERLSHPHRSYRSIHVAGTNGKGSVATKIASALESEGYKTALYTSPHIVSFRERIRINGKMIPNADLEPILHSLFAIVEKMGGEFSFFDLATAAAFVYFAKEKVDFAVIETGIGGRLDATNVIWPLLSVITSIGFDHQRLLGNSLFEIAKEKGGIVKPGIPLIVGPKAAPFFPDGIRAPEPKECFYDAENSSTARTALIELQKQIPLHEEAIEKGLLKRPPCRFQVVGPLILDVAHNPDGFEKLAEALKTHFPGRKFPFYMAFSADKDWMGCIEKITPCASKLFFLKGSYPRLLPPEFLQARFPGSEIVSPGEVKEGIVCGSFYIMKEWMDDDCFC